MYFSFIFIILRFIIGNRFIPRILSCLAEPDALRLCLAFPGRRRLCKVPYKARFRSDKHAAVLRLQRTQPKDRRVYDAPYRILSIAGAGCGKKGNLRSGQAAHSLCGRKGGRNVAQVLERACLRMNCGGSEIQIRFLYSVV